MLIKTEGNIGIYVFEPSTVTTDCRQRQERLQIGWRRSETEYLRVQKRKVTSLVEKIRGGIKMYSSYCLDVNNAADLNVGYK